MGMNALREVWLHAVTLADDQALQISKIDNKDNVVIAQQQHLECRQLRTAQPMRYRSAPLVLVQQSLMIAV